MCTVACWDAGVKSLYISG